MNSLSYGVELELLVLPKIEEEETAALFRMKKWNFGTCIDRPERKTNSTILRQILAEELEKKNIPAHLTRRAYNKWIIDRDGSIFEPRDENGVRSFYGIELTSRTMYDLQASMAELDKLWQTINQHFEVMQHGSCGTHIHVGTKNDWSLQDIKKITKGWSWFEEEITKTLPESTRICEWARPNCSTTYEPRWNAANEMVRLYQEAVRDQLFAPLFQYIEDATSMDEIIEKTAPERCLSWNLQNLRNKCGTIEFRRVPQSKNASDCKH